MAIETPSSANESELPPCEECGDTGVVYSGDGEILCVECADERGEL